MDSKLKITSKVTTTLCSRAFNKKSNLGITNKRYDHTRLHLCKLDIFWLVKIKAIIFLIFKREYNYEKKIVKHWYSYSSGLAIASKYNYFRF